MFFGNTIFDKQRGLTLIRILDLRAKLPPRSRPGNARNTSPEENPTYSLTIIHSSFLNGNEDDLTHMIENPTDTTFHIESLHDASTDIRLSDLDLPEVSYTDGGCVDVDEWHPQSFNRRSRPSRTVRPKSSWSSDRNREFDQPQHQDRSRSHVYPGPPQRQLQHGRTHVLEDSCGGEAEWP